MRCFVSTLLSKPGLLALAAVAWLFMTASPAGATVTLEVCFADDTLADGSVAILVADVNGDGFLPFTEPATVGTVLTRGEFVGGSDDVILAVIQADAGAHWNGSAGIADTVESLDYAEFGIAPGTPLILYLFPDVIQPDQAVALNEDVVAYRKTDPGGSGGDIAFVAPADPGVYTLSALTATHGGSFDPQNPDPGETSNRADAGVPGSAVGTDEHGDSSNRATPLTSGRGVPGYLSTGDVDFFSIAITGTSRVIAYTTGGTDTTGFLFDAGATLLNDPGLDDDRGGNGNFRLEEIVTAPGTLNLAVRGKGDVQTGAYQLIVEVIPLRVTNCPDVTIGKSLASQRGDGRYNRSGAGQKLKLVSKKRRKLKYYFTVQNDCDLPGVISLTATPKDKLFKVKYLRISGGRANLTGVLKRGAYEASLAGLEKEAFLLIVKPSPKAKRGKKTFIIDAKSADNRLDRAKAEARSK